MAKYRKCPRCEVNYITDQNEYCDICLAEMSGLVLNIDVEEDELELCAKCHQNYVADGERFCESCLAELSKLKGGAVGDIDWPEEEEAVDTIVDDEEIFEPDEVSLEGLVDEEWSDDSLDDDNKSPDDTFVDDIIDLDLNDFADDESDVELAEDDSIEEP
ncbi:MAG: zinc ribbon domain-containing protein [Christensenellaceae bacterium]|jgi:hypothetical protein|nr:zinc ribbon domain-containing protein [Christensenellaceae bacterium]